MNSKNNVLSRSATLWAVALTLGLWLGAAPARADFTYHFTVDTSTLKGQSGSLDFQFNPGMMDDVQESLPATAKVSGFLMTGGQLAGAAELTGAAEGSLPGT